MEKQDAGRRSNAACDSRGQWAQFRLFRQASPRSGCRDLTLSIRSYKMGNGKSTSCAVPLERGYVACAALALHALAERIPCTPQGLANSQKEHIQ